MIDYRAHLAALTALEDSLASQALPEPGLAARRDEDLAAVTAHPGAAALGALVDHLVAHAASDGWEIDLLGRAATLWGQGVDLYHAIGTCRHDIETALAAPDDPQSPATFNATVERFRQLALTVGTLWADADALRGDVVGLRHVPEHPRQQDLSLERWGWGDVLLARRTDAFARAVHTRAGDAPQRAFAVGVLSAYSANVCGSGYLGRVVGGPRRSHRFRDRLARNAMGSWFAQRDPRVPGLSSLADLLGQGAPTPSLPAGLATLVTTAVGDTFDPARTGPLPDLELGLQRLVTHLRLLDGFAVPPPPQPPAEPFLALLFGDPTSPPPTLLVPATVAGGNPSAPGVNGSAPTNYAGTGSPGTSDSAPSTTERCGNFWMAAVYFIMFLALGHIYCIGRWMQDLRCELWDAIEEEWRKANQPSQEQMEQLAGQSQPVTAETFPVVAASPQVVTMVGNLFELQTQLWEALEKAGAFLAVHGLVYPDGRLGQPLFRQFLAMPPTSPDWPRRPDPDPRATYHLPPTGPVEDPAGSPPPYPSGTDPAVFTGAVPPTYHANAADLGLFVWRQTVNGELDAANHDQDADRGFLHPCWDAEGSVTLNPVQVRVLTYPET